MAKNKKKVIEVKIRYSITIYTKRSGVALSIPEKYEAIEYAPVQGSLFYWCDTKKVKHWIPIIDIVSVTVEEKVTEKIKI